MKSKGLTLVELMICILIVCIISALILPLTRCSSKRSINVENVSIEYNKRCFETDKLTIKNNRSKKVTVRIVDNYRFGNELLGKVVTVKPKQMVQFHPNFSPYSYYVVEDGQEIGYSKMP